MPATMKRCYEYLNKTSRSFSAVIQALDSELRLVYYLLGNGAILSFLLGDYSCHTMYELLLGNFSSIFLFE